MGEEKEPSMYSMVILFWLGILYTFNSQNKLLK